MRHQTSLVSARPWGAQFPGFITVVCSLCMSTRTPSFLSCDRKTLHLGPLLPPNSSSSLPPVLPPLSRSPFPDFRSLSAFPFSILHSPFSSILVFQFQVAQGQLPVQAQQCTAVHNSTAPSIRSFGQLVSVNPPVRTQDPLRGPPLGRSLNPRSQFKVSIQGLNSKSPTKLQVQARPTDRPCLEPAPSTPTSQHPRPACQPASIIQINQSLKSINRSIKPYQVST